MANFVKFSRGLLNTYNNLANKDPDTLYLVYESSNSETGSLYLGNKLISSTKNADIKLSDLISGTPSEGMILQYNETTGGGVWEPVALDEVIQGIPSSNLSIVDTLDNILSPKEKDVAIIGDNAYVYNGEDWIHLTNSNLEDRVESLENAVGQPANPETESPATGIYADIEDFKTDVMSQLADAQHLQYQKVNDISEIDLTDTEANKNTIFLVPKTNEGGDSDGYDEYFVVDGALERLGALEVNSDQLLTEEQKQKLDSLGFENGKATIQAAQVGSLIQTIEDTQLIKKVDVGTFNVTEEGELQLKDVPSINLSNYVQKSLFQATVGDLSKLNNPAKEENNTLVDEINLIKTSIIWQELTQQQNG